MIGLRDPQLIIHPDLHDAYSIIAISHVHRSRAGLYHAILQVQENMFSLLQPWLAERHFFRVSCTTVSINLTFFHDILVAKGDLFTGPNFSWIDPGPARQEDLEAFRMGYYLTGWTHCSCILYRPSRVGGEIAENCNAEWKCRKGLGGCEPCCK